MDRPGSVAKLGLDLSQLKRRALADQTQRAMTQPVQMATLILLPVMVKE